MAKKSTAVHPAAAENVTAENVPAAAQAAPAGVRHGCTCEGNPLLPQICRVIRITQETPDVKTFRIQTPDGGKPFDPMPGQLAMISVMGAGEAMFSITAKGDDWLESSIKRVGALTDALHGLAEGDLIGLRGPYGNHFPVDAIKGKDILFVGGGIGLAPVRSLIRYALEHRTDYGQLDVLYGSRSYADLVFKADIFENWPGKCNTHITIDNAEDAWDGHVGFVPSYLEEKAFSPEGKVVVLCGPPIMIKFCLDSLMKMGFSKENVITTLEMRMKCGIGKCGRCNIGSKYVCLDGPVFSMSELDELPDEK
ncbi:MAG: FAD/NAD(P)-binding protein [Clostridiales Family XIII bacterium]|jgi:NAD(P)H-flavin reductase|nr:FAD/NAD(P)-binding protein [Clostridiales Family XIII bacterium]